MSLKSEKKRIKAYIRSLDETERERLYRFFVLRERTVVDAYLGNPPASKKVKVRQHATSTR